MLDEFAHNITGLPFQTYVVMGDFNSKTEMWGSPRTDARGESVVEWAEFMPS